MCVYSKSTYSHKMASPQRNGKREKNQRTHSQKNLYNTIREASEIFLPKKLCKFMFRSVQFNSILFLSFLAIHAVAAFHFYTFTFAQFVCEFSISFSPLLLLLLPLVVAFISRFTCMLSPRRNRERMAKEKEIQLLLPLLCSLKCICAINSAYISIHTIIVKTYYRPFFNTQILHAIITLCMCIH